MKVSYLGSNEKKNLEKDLNKIESWFVERKQNEQLENESAKM